MKIVSTVLASVALAARELTPDDFNEVVYESGKGTFIKFLAPWWGHCKNMKPDWDKLETEFKSSDLVTIADVDCTAKGEPLCSQVGVQGYPTIKYWTETSPKKGSDYNGGRDYEGLKKFVETTFKPRCDVTTLEGCSDEQKEYIGTIKDKSAEDLTSEKLEHSDAIDAIKKERTDAKKELKDKVKAWKVTEKALNMKLRLIAGFEKLTDKKDEL